MNRIISLALAIFMLPVWAAAEEPQEDHGGTPQSSVVYTKAGSLSDGGYAAFDVGGYTFGISRGEIAVKESELTDEGLTVSRSNCFKAILADENGFYLTSEDPPGNLCYIYIGAEGTLEQGRDVPDGSWTYDEAEQALFYSSDGQAYYLNPSADGIDVSSENAGSTALYTGETAPGGGGHGRPEEKAEETDDAAPVIINQPEAAHYVIEGSGYDAPVFSLEAQLPEGSDMLFFQWYVDGAEAGEPQEFAGDAKSIFTAEELTDRAAGVYRVYCEAYCYTKDEAPPDRENDNAEVQEDAGEVPDSDIPAENYDEAEPHKHSARSYETVFVVCTGVESNSFLTFSDVHQTFSNIGTAIEDIMSDNAGRIPALIVCSGDWVNRVHYMGDSEEYYEKTRDELICRMALQTGGIDTVYVSGNHDNGRAAAEATINAHLGAAEDYDGVGIIYDSRAENKNGSAAENTGLIVIGINYENTVSLDGSSVVSADYAPVIEELEKTLEEIKENYSGELIVISAHLGLHTLGIQPESAQSGTDQWAGKNEYNADNSDKMVELLNEYAKRMDMIYFFGHDHSKGEREFLLLPGQTIVSTASYEDRSTAENKLNFAYGHAGYITDGINGVELYSFVKWTESRYTREARKADGEKAVDIDLTKTVTRLRAKKRSSSGSQPVRLSTERPVETPTVNPTIPPTAEPTAAPTEKAIPTAEPTAAPVPTQEPKKNDRFADVKDTDWFYEPVYRAFADGLMNGVSETEFAPDLSVTRAMLVSVLYRLDGEKPVSFSGSFTDADYGDYYGNALRWAEESGIANGYDPGHFVPHGSVTREQAAAMLFRYAEYKGADLSDVQPADYADSDDISAYANEAVGWSTAQGILKGFEDNTVRPGETATRAQLAVMLGKAAELIVSLI